MVKIDIACSFLTLIAFIAVLLNCKERNLKYIQLLLDLR